MPRQGHLEAELHIMVYLNLSHNSRLAFDPSYPNINQTIFQEWNWTDFYEGAVEAIPPNAPLLRGKEFDLCMFLYSNHAGKKQTTRSRTWFMVKWTYHLLTGILMNQSTKEISVLCMEFIAMKVGTVTLHAIQHKLRMMGISITGASYVYGDNMLVIHTTFHKSVAMEESFTGHIRSE